MPFDSQEVVCNFWRSVIAQRSEHEPEKEALIVLLLNTRLYLKGYHLVSLGSVNEALAHPREVLRPAIVMAAYAFIVLHNHPSGDPAPSTADRKLTRDLREASSIMKIEMLDHIIVGDLAFKPSYFSFREAGFL